MIFLVIPFLLCLQLSNCTPTQRASRSLEPASYVAPGEPYLPPNVVQPDTKDYLPPLPEHEAVDFVETSVSTQCDSGACQQAVSVSSVPCQEQRPCSISQTQEVVHDQPNESEGYFYPKPAKPFEILPRINEISRTLEEGLPLEDGPTTTIQPVVADTEPPAQVSSDGERARRGTSKLQTSPEHGPVRISTQPFNLKKSTDSKAYLNKKPILRKV